ncbi:condensation domain-containing protein, partial [Streptomyces sp. NPDC059037]|uniref:condensation domain-containing protein n=1 Tax=Streptomyces sp. NPDC059037 TaxID=3346710 RepID=UPI00368A261A
MADHQGAYVELSLAGRETWHRAHTPQGLSGPGPYVAEAVDIDGPLDVAGFRSAVAQVVQEAEAVRLRIPAGGADGGAVKAEVDDGLPLPEVDLSAESDPDAAAEEWTRAALARVLPDEDGTLSVQVLLRLSARRHRWLHLHHRAALDGYGTALVTRRAAEIYTARAEGLPLAGTALTPLGRLADEEAAYRASSGPDRDRSFWRERLAGHTEPVTLAGTAEPGTAEPGPASQELTLTAADAERIHAAARYSGARPQAVLVAAVAAYTHRITGSTDLVVGLPVDGRPSRAAERCPGAADDVLPLRLTVRPDTGFSHLVQHVTEASGRVRAHQRLRHAEIRAAVHAAGPTPAADTGRPLYGPVADVRTPGPRIRFGALTATVRRFGAEPDTGEDLRVVIDDDPADGRPRIAFRGAPGAYTTPELAAHARRFQRLLVSAVAAPGRPVGAIELLGGAELAAVRNWSRGDEQRLPDRRTLTGLLDAAALRAPEAVAVKDRDGSLTYRELHERANRLARLLVQRGAGPEGVVGILLPRSAETVVAMLAVLKSGAAYLPLDPAYPADRLRFMVDDARPAVVLTDAAHADLAAPTLVLD